MNETNNNPSAPSPDGINDLFIGYWKTGVIKAAIELDVFSGIAGGENSVQKLAVSRSIKERGLRALLDSLCGLRLLNKAKGVYVLTPEAAHFLVKGKPSYLGGAVKAFAASDDWEVMGRIEEAIQSAGPLIKDEREPLFWQEVARGLMPLALGVGQFICDTLNIKPGCQEGLKVLDIACGSGAYGFSVLQRDSAAFGTALRFRARADADRRSGP